MKSVSYYPANAGWSLMWENFDPQVIDQDFAKIAALGADTVRVIVQPGAIGWPVPDSFLLGRVDYVVQYAAKNGLKTHLTLFDQYPKVFVDIAGSKTWAHAVLSFAGLSSDIACVELHNEVDPTNPTVMAWTKTMLPYVRKVGGHPVTVSIADKGYAAFTLLTSQLSATPPDFWNYHYYGPAANAVTVLGQVKSACHGRPLFIGETGQSTYGHTDLQVQANYLTYIGKACAHLDLPPPAPWILNDFTPTGIPGGSGSGKEYGFGLYRADGTAKPSADAVRLMFGGAA